MIHELCLKIDGLMLPSDESGVKSMHETGPSC